MPVKKHKEKKASGENTEEKPCVDSAKEKHIRRVIQLSEDRLKR